MSYAYDAFNRLLSAGSMSLTYDPAGRLYETTASGTTTRFLYAGLQAIAEYNTSGTLLRRYVPGVGLDEHLVWYEGGGTSDRRWFVQDERGSVVATSDGSGAALSINSYDEYGLPASGNSGLFGYTGQMHLSAAGLYHYRARAYSPSLGRFLQTDPIGMAGGMNLYAYVQNDSVNFTDPLGLRVFFGARSVWGGVHYFFVVDTGDGHPRVISYGPSTGDIFNPGLLVPSAGSIDQTNEHDLNAYLTGEGLVGIRELAVSDGVALATGEIVDALVRGAGCEYDFLASDGCNSTNGARMMLEMLLGGYDFNFAFSPWGFSPGWDNWERLLLDSSGCRQNIPDSETIYVCGERTGGVGGGYGGIGLGGTLGMGSRPMPGVQGGLCGRMPCHDPTARPPRTR